MTGTHGSSFSSGRSSANSDHRAPRSSRPGVTTTSCSSRSSSRRSSSRTSWLIVSSTSSRTGFAPRRRRRSTLWIASSRSSASSSSSSRSASRVTRNAWCATISMPGNSRSRCAAITFSSGTNRSPSGSATNRGSSGGTFTRANLRSPGHRVAHHRREVERQVRDVRERVRGVDRQRGEHREDALVELLLEEREVRAVQRLDRAHDPDPLLLERRHELGGEERSPRGSTAPARARGSPRAARRASGRRANA